MTRTRILPALQVIVCSSIVALNGTLACAQPASYKTETRYDGGRRVTGMFGPDPDGSGPLHLQALRNSYDSAGRLLKTEKGELTNWQAETVAPANWSGFAIFSASEFFYDAFDRKRVEQVRGTDGNIKQLIQYSYDNADRLLCTAVRMNPASYESLPASACDLATEGSYGPDRITRNVYDAAGQLVQVRKGVGTPLEQADATYSYTPNGKQEFVIDAVGNRAKLEYDGFGRQLKWIFPSTTKSTAYDPTSQSSALNSAGSLNTGDYEQYDHDSNGNRTWLRKRDGQVINYTYDALNRLKKKYGAVPTIDYTYNLQGLQLTATFASNGQGITSTYDGFGRLKTSTSNMGGTSRTLSYEYDLNGNRERLTFPDSQFFTYVYDGLNRMTAIKENGATQIATQTYNNKGQRSGLTGGVSTSYGYDGIGRLSGLSHDLAGSFYDVSYSFPGYNPASQMLQRTRSSNVYAYGAYSNANTSYTANGLNQYSAVGGASFCYDPNGNLTSDGTVAYRYDAENRMTERRALSGGSCPVSYGGALTVSLAYDPNGRLSQTSGTETRQYLYDGDSLVAEYDGAGALLRRYVHGSGVDEPLLWYEGTDLSDRRVLRADHQGSIVSVANGNGAMVATNSYDEYGLPAANNLGRFSYTGQIWIPELGLHHYKARMYSPELGRFMQTDPIGYKDQINLYAYVGNDPINKVDPMGEEGADTRTDEQKRYDSCEGAAGCANLLARPGGTTGNAQQAAKSSRLSYEDISKLVAQNNQSEQSDNLLIAQIYKESRFDASAKSKTSTATGLMQMTKGAVVEVNRVNKTQYSHSDMTDAEKNISAGSAYLQIRIDRAGGNVTRGLEGYGTGPGYAKSILSAEAALNKNSSNPMTTLRNIVGK